MIAELNHGADLVVGSRYVAGGSTSEDWGFLRWINSRVATLLARPLTDLHDPMSGFFALRRATFESGREFDPLGYKIGLEILVKCECRSPLEIPIHFENRRFGKSKLTIQQKVLYLRHLSRLYLFRYRMSNPLTRFFLWASSGRS
jgi:dolichol-phosphate mannosyltransferase